MPRETGSGNGEQTSFQADKKSIITSVEDLKDVSVERKDQYLKRIAKENEALKSLYVVEDEYVEVIGKKVLRKIKKRNGNQYTLYWFNNKRHKEQYQNLLAKGGYERENNEGEKVFVPLKFVDGRAFKKGK